MEHLLVLALAAGFVLYLYDLLVTGPAWARPLVPAVPVGAGFALLELDVLADAPLAFASAFLALLLVALLEWLQVARDAAMMAAMRRR